VRAVLQASTVHGDRRSSRLAWRRRVPAFSRLCALHYVSSDKQTCSRPVSAESSGVDRGPSEHEPDPSVGGIGRPVGCLAVRFRSHPLRPSRVRPRSGEPDDAIGHAATHPVFLPASDGPSDVPGCGDGAYAMQEYPNRRGFGPLRAKLWFGYQARRVGNWSAVMKRPASR
jgi:hypothetical protein